MECFVVNLSGMENRSLTRLKEILSEAWCRIHCSTVGNGFDIAALVLAEK